MSSILKTTNIKHESSSSNNLVLASDGSFSGTFNGTVGTSASGFGLITHADFWRLTTSVSGPATYITGSGTFVRVTTSVTSTSPGTIGSAMSYNSTTGVFTFPVTGKWLVTAYATHYSSSGAQAYAGMYIYATINNNVGSPTWSTNAIQLTSVSATNYYNSGSTAHLFNCTNTSTHAVRMYRATSDSDLRMIGGSAQNESFVTFLRLGDT
jgi:hypothetical protein